MGQQTPYRELIAASLQDDRGDVADDWIGIAMSLALAASKASSPAEDHLSRLKAERSALDEERQRIGSIVSKLNDAKRREDDALAAIGEHGRAETAAMTEWATQGAKGEPPQPDMAKRKKLAEGLASAQAAADSARGAGSDLDERYRSLSAKIVEADHAIDVAAAELMAEQIAADRPRLEKLAREVADGVAKAAALRMFAGAHGRSVADGGNIEGARPFFSLVGRLTGEAAIETMPTHVDVSAAIEAHRRRFADLRKT